MLLELRREEKPRRTPKRTDAGADEALQQLGHGILEIHCTFCTFEIHLNILVFETRLYCMMLVVKEIAITQRI
jgi:hypothetical protein